MKCPRLGPRAGLSEENDPDAAQTAIELLSTSTSSSRAFASLLAIIPTYTPLETTWVLLPRCHQQTSAPRLSRVPFRSPLDGVQRKLGVILFPCARVGPHDSRRVLHTRCRHPCSRTCIGARYTALVIVDARPFADSARPASLRHRHRRVGLAPLCLLLSMHALEHRYVCNRPVIVATRARRAWQRLLRFQLAHGQRNP